ncbi:hypothetical protein P9112_000970 [Eukaryota sp. TZLM1-RC]
MLMSDPGHHSLPNCISAAFFDLDGTLVENVEHVVDSYLDALLHFKLPTTTRQHLRDIQGLSFEATCNVIGVPEDLVADFSVVFWKKMEVFNSTPELLPGVLELLHYLDKHNIPMSIVTNNRTHIAKAACKMAGIDHFFKNYLGSDVVDAKPNPAGILKLCSLHNIVPSEEVLYIGDSSSDMKAAMNAKVTGVWVVSSKDFEVRYTNDLNQYFDDCGFRFSYFPCCLNFKKQLALKMGC